MQTISNKINKSPRCTRENCELQNENFIFSINLRLECYTESHTMLANTISVSSLPSHRSTRAPRKLTTVEKKRRRRKENKTFSSFSHGVRSSIWRPTVGKHFSHHITKLNHVMHKVTQCCYFSSRFLVCFFGINFRLSTI